MDDAAERRWNRWHASATATLVLIVLLFVIFQPNVGWIYLPQLQFSAWLWAMVFACILGIEIGTWTARKTSWAMRTEWARSVRSASRHGLWWVLAALLVVPATVDPIPITLISATLGVLLSGLGVGGRLFDEAPPRLVGVFHGGRS